MTLKLGTTTPLIIQSARSSSPVCNSSMQALEIDRLYRIRKWILSQGIQTNSLQIRFRIDQDQSGEIFAWYKHRQNIQYSISLQTTHVEDASMQTTDFVATIFDGKSDPNKVTVAFTMALNALNKGYSATLILMVEAVELGVPGAAEGIDIGKPFEPVANLLEQYLEKGGRIAICGACMLHNGMTAEQMAPGYEIISAPDVVELLMHAKGSLQVT